MGQNGCCSTTANPTTTAVPTTATDSSHGCCGSGCVPQSSLFGQSAASGVLQLISCCCCCPDQDTQPNALRPSRRKGGFVHLVCLSCLPYSPDFAHAQAVGPSDFTYAEFAKSSQPRRCPGLAYHLLAHGLCLLGRLLSPHAFFHRCQVLGHG